MPGVAIERCHQRRLRRLRRHLLPAAYPLGNLCNASLGSHVAGDSATAAIGAHGGLNGYADNAVDDAANGTAGYNANSHATATGGI